jgi:hypothetical protein
MVQAKGPTLLFAIFVITAQISPLSFGTDPMNDGRYIHWTIKPRDFSNITAVRVSSPSGAGVGMPRSWRMCRELQ